MVTHENVFLTFQDVNYIDLTPIQCGHEVCEPGHAFGPAQRSHYLFHYIIGGRGTLYANDEAGRSVTHHLRAGQGFMIFPQQVTTYVADLHDPWEYTWIEFDGLRVKETLELVGLSPSTPTYQSTSAELRERMLAEIDHLVRTSATASVFQNIGHLYLFLDYLTTSIDVPRVLSNSKLQDFYIREAVTYVERHYQQDITVEDIASNTGLNRSYFGKLFKAAVGRTPQQFLIRYRMTKAAELLKLTTLSVAEVGKQVGYPNQLHFSRAFKGVHGVSPREWRKRNGRNAQ